MKSTARLMKPQATRLATFAIALTGALGTSMTAKSVDSRTENASDKFASHSAPARSGSSSASAHSSAARPAQSSARAGSAGRPSQTSNRATAAPRSAAPRSAATNRSAAARPNSARTASAAHANPARSNSQRANADRGREANHREENRSVARGGERGRAGESHDFRNASYSHGENLHGGRQIPADRFHASFGRDHQFHIGHPVMIGGQSSFQFGGFWFGIVDPWPVGWLYTDPVYVDYVDGGYALVNVVHPGVEVAVSAGDPAPANCPAADPDTTAPVAPAAPVRTATVAYVPVPFYTYFTWHYWRHYWR